MRNQCYECKYRGKALGDAHSCCRYPGNEVVMFDLFSEKNEKNARRLHIKADACGVRNGWFYWPVNFDPVWLTNCDGFTPRGERAEREMATAKEIAGQNGEDKL